MHGNNPRNALGESTTHRGVRPGMDPDELSADDRESLKQFESDLVTATQEYLPGEYTIGTEFRTGQQTVTLFLVITAPSGAQLQYQIHPTTGDKDSEDAPSDAERMSEVDSIAQQFAAMSAHQFMEMGKQNGIPQRGS